MKCIDLYSIYRADKAEITFEQDTINATVNHEFKLNPVVTGDSKEVVYDFDASTFESVSEGTFKAKAAGDYKIKVFLKEDAEVFAEVNVKVDNNHTYDKEVVSEEYFASDASCTEKAKYYYSCSCGAKGEETFESGDALTHTFDQEVMDEKYAVEGNACKFYYSCVCGAKGEETFANVNPVEVAVTLADDSVAGLDAGTYYEYNKEQYIVGLTAFATISEALAYATEIVYVADGEYNENITINKSNIKLLGNNANINPNIQTRKDESVLKTN